MGSELGLGFGLGLPESRAPARMAMAVAKHLTMLSAYCVGLG